MRRVRFRDPAGSVRTGEWTDDAIVFDGRAYAPGAVDVLPPCEPSKIVCVGWNYRRHAEEKGIPIPDRPSLFLKGPNALAGHGDVVPLPPGVDLVEFEGELAVVIGEQCRNVPEADAMDVIAGYTCFNDVSNRDDQNREQNWVRGKAFDNSAPLGPVLATPEHVPDDARIRTWLNGELRQDSSIAQFIFPIAEVIADVTSFLTLEPGDVIATGTPEGVGPLAAGDTVEIEIEGIGRLEHGVGAPS